jgi:hypothetical protein
MLSNSLIKPVLLKWDLAHRRFVLFLMSVFAVLCMLGLHGYSLPMWHEYLDHTKPVEVKFNEPQGIRSDDWALDLPMVIAQAASSPRFPVDNPNIGDGQNMMMPMQTPVLHPISLFRPSTWGFIFGVDAGLAWMWWSVLLGLFYGIFLLLQLLTKNRFWWSILGSAGFCSSPMIQMWSLHKAQIPLHATFLLVAVVHILYSKRPKIILWNGVLLGWSTGCLAFHYIYPPIQVTIGLLMAAIAVGYIVDHRKILDLKEALNFRVGAIFIALLIVSLAVVSFWVSGRDQMQSIMHTTYPGQRFSLGGGMQWNYFFTNYFLVLDPKTNWGNWGNVCEASFGMFFAPLIFLGQLMVCIQKKRWPSVLSIILAAFIVFMLSYSIIGFPEWLAEITMMKRSTSNRTQMALLLADLCLAAVVCSEMFDGSQLRYSMKNIWQKGLLAAAWTGLLGYVLSSLMGGSPHYPARLAVKLLSLNFILALIFLGFKRPVWFFAGILMINFYGTYRFNPVVRGGIDYLRNNAISKDVLIADGNFGPGKWAVISDQSLWPLGNLLRMLGVKSIGGYGCGPPLKSLSILDPEGKFAGVYNQCAFLTFVPEVGPNVYFTSPSPGQIVANISANNAAFSRLGVDFFLFIGGSAPDPIDLARFDLQTPLPAGYRIYHRKSPTAGFP